MNETDEKLSAIVTALHRLQTEGQEDAYCIFTASIAKNYYIQFSGSSAERKLYAEAVSNRFLEETHTLNAQKLTALTRLGWLFDPQEAPNFYRICVADRADDRADIAKIVVRTLVEIYGLQIDQPLIVNVTLG